MKKGYLLLMLGISLGCSVSAQNLNAPILSPHTKSYLHHLSKQPGDVLKDGYIYKTLADGRTAMAAMVRVTNPERANRSLKAINAVISTKAGNIWTILVPLDQVAQLSQLKGIDYVQLDQPLYPLMDAARFATRTDSVHKGFDLPQAYTGKDVVMGVIDFGFDYNHPSFYDTAGTVYRIKRSWELNSTGTPPTGFVYGHELKDAASLQAQGTDNEEQTHGSGVAGIAAGSGYGGPTATLTRGVAFESDLVFVGVRRQLIAEQWRQGGFSDFVDGINYIFKYADEVGKPAVVNISWGSHSGPHDGSNLFNQACDNLSGEGKMIVMSAGNDGTDSIHLAKTFSGNDTVVHTFLSFNPTASTPPGNDYKRTWVDIWGEAGKSFCAKMSLYENGTQGNFTEISCTGDGLKDTFLISANGLDTCFIEFIGSPSEFNGKPRLTVVVHNKTDDDAVISVSGKEGKIHMWNEYYFYGYIDRYTGTFSAGRQSWATSGDNTHTTSDMGSAESVLLVGAYASKVAFRDIHNIQRSYATYVGVGNIAPFSSRGPRVDGRVKPDIAAPGLTLATAVNSHDKNYTPTGASASNVIASWVNPNTNDTFYFGEFIGTSASAPVASGIVALMLQANPKLTPEQVIQIVKETAITDIRTGNLPAEGNNTWGHGKINAYAAVKRAAQLSGIYTFTGKQLDCLLYPNPANKNFVLEYTGTEKENLQITLIDITGRAVYNEEWQVNNGWNQKQIDVSTIAPGIYLVKLAAAGGTATIKVQIGTTN